MPSIPQAPGAIPLFGHSIQLFRDPISFLSGLPKEKITQIRIGPMKAIVILDRELTKQVLRDDKTFDKGGPFFHRLREVMGNGLGTCPRSEHRQQRRLIQPAFHHSRMESYSVTMQRQIAAVIDGWSDGQEIDGRAEMMDLTTRVAVATMFSDSLSDHDVRETNIDFATIVRTMYKRMLTPSPFDKIPTPEKQRYDAARSRIKNRTEKIISERRKAGCPDMGDLLSVLLSARMDDGRELNSTEIHDHLSTFFMAGVMTTASSLSWTLHLISQNPEIQKQLQSESDNILGDRKIANAADLESLEFARRVLLESLRLWAPGWFVTRVAVNDTELAGYPITSGRTIIFSPFLLHRQEDTYPNADSFDPDRWLLERDNIPRDAHIPFGDGPRKCIADAFSLMQSTLVISAIASRWELSPAPSAEVRPSYGAVISPNGLRLTVSDRLGSTSANTLEFK
ncbi:MULTISPECIES: cytochrome P450 [Streptomyces]|uniref:cytochrome P450 n=1 Tax=Streptomyces TaxID=1883 RepID=UPI000AB66AD4|nr:cytochrome P450 [Streptomyces virginiae]